MVISENNKFCFFAIPRTTSQALSKHLIRHYEAAHIVPMHMTFDEFAMSSNILLQDYFTFTTIRSPLDSIISAYLKKKTNHNERFSRGTFSNGKKIGQKAMEEYHYIKTHNASFQDYFIKFHMDEYEIPRHEKTVEKVNCVLRFETLQSDFNGLCSEQNWPQIPIEDFNRTKAPSRNLNEYYTPEIRPLARKTFGRLMKLWDYSFPSGW